MAHVTEQGTASATIPTGTTTWAIDPVHSVVEFAVRHMMVSTVKGRFTDIRGTIRLDEDQLTQSSVEAEIVAASIDTRDPKRDAHLRSADFLDVEQYPNITFKSTRVEPKGKDRARIVGNLTIRGTTKEVTLDATLNGVGKTPFGTEVAGFSAETSLNRKDWGLNWNVALETGGVLVGDTVKITIEVEAVKQ